jgi:hypothetical protein
LPYWDAYLDPEDPRVDPDHVGVVLAPAVLDGPHSRGIDHNGTALGAAASGLLVEQMGFRAALQVAGVMVAAGAATAFFRRKMLELEGEE